MKPGTMIAPKTRAPISREQLKAYAEASGDPNPIHLDDEVAKKSGLPGIIAHGMLIAAFLSDRAREIAAEAGPTWRIASTKTRFRAMTLLGDVISVGGEVKDATQDSATLELAARKESGEVVVTATVQLSSKA